MMSEVAMRRLRVLACCLGLALAAPGFAQTSEDWPHWRGPQRNGIADGHRVPLTWGPNHNIRWSVTLPGSGTSSPVVRGAQVFVTTQVQQEQKKSLLTLCFDRTSGRELWRHDYGLGVDQRTHPSSNLAVNTPAVSDDALYVAFGNSDIARYSHDGRLHWVQRYFTLFGDPKMSWGYGVSPLVLEDSVFLPWNHHKGPCYLVGLDPATGHVAWKKDRPIGTAHATPLVVAHHGQTDLLVPGQNRLTAFDARTRQELWCYGEGSGPFNGEVVGSPTHGDGLVFTQLWRESPVHALRLQGNGQPPEKLWISKKPAGEVPSLLYYRGLVYVVLDSGILSCLDAQTGEEVYRERLGKAVYSSPVACDGHLFVSDQDGRTHVLKAGRTFVRLHLNLLGERIVSSPAIVDDTLLYRTDSHLYCVGEPPAK